MGYIIEISERKKEKMSGYAEQALRAMGKLMSCIEELDGEMGERSGGGRGGRGGNYGGGSMGNRYGERYMGNRYGERDWEDDDDWEDEEEMGERRRRSRRTGRFIRG